MPLVLVSHVKLRSTLSTDVHTSLGGLLMEKGTKLTERHLEVLQAFLIEQVEVDEEQPVGRVIMKSSNTAPSPSSVNPVKLTSLGPKSPSVPQQPIPKRVESDSFQTCFFRAVQFFKDMFHSVAGGLAIPMLELRDKITPLLKFSSDLNHIMMTLKQNYPIEDYTYYHSISVGFLSVSIARWSRIPDEELGPIMLSGVLHDIGKSKINPNILFKTETLEPEEITELRKYPVYSYHLVKAIPHLTDGVALGVLQHQEREDGSGYPLALQSQAIHRYAKIIAIADIFHAMGSSKSYKQGHSPYIVLEQLLSDSFGKLDPAYVRTFVDGMTQFTLGTQVELQDGSVGKIVYVDRSQPTRPIVDVHGKIVNLAINRNLYIRQVIIE